MLIRKTNSLLNIFNSSLIDLPRPSNINYLWNFGRLLGTCLIIQIIRGLVLSIHFSRDTLIAFRSVDQISRNVNIGWLIRIIHANGASFFFIVVYVHIARGIYYISFYNKLAWVRGVLIFLILMGTAFLGYVLPWGQISFWGATVITNLLSAIPYLGVELTYWVWGGFSVDHPTLIRFFSLHFLLPFIILLLIVVHILFLHERGSRNPLGSSLSLDKIPFHPYFSRKDIFGAIVLIILIIILILLRPYYFIDPDNFIPANPLITPPHIQPEWYFLFAYAILRSIPNKLGGVIALFSSIIILITFCFSVKSKFYTNFYPGNKILFWHFSIVFLILTYLGACAVEMPFIDLRILFSALYFIYFFINPIMLIKM